MKQNDVVRAAEMIEQYNKLLLIRSEFASEPDSMVLTLRQGRHSRSVTLNEKTMVTDLLSMVDELINKTHQHLVDLGVDLDG